MNANNENNENKIILVVEDEQSIIDMLTMDLCDKGYTVVIATDGLDALAKLETVTPDLILCDVKMEPLDGIAFVYELDRLGKHGLYKIIMMTAWGDIRANEISELLKEGCISDAAIKPFSYIISLYDKIDTLTHQEEKED